MELGLVHSEQEQVTNNRILVWLLVLLTLLAFGLRVYCLDRRSLWTDEGLSVYRARQDVTNILSGEIVIQGTVSKDTQPPL